MARRAAVQALYQWQLTHQAPQDIEIHYSLDHELEGIDVAYFHELVSQIPLHQHELDDQLIPHLDRELEDVDPVERAILRIGAYELEFRAEIPYKVVLNETIKLAKTFGAEHGHKYVNAVLDKVASTLRAREIDAERSPSSTTI
jgi:N utilization substance protein B